MNLRNATMEDAMFIYKLRFSKDAIENSWSKEIPTFKKHKEWFNKHLLEYKIIEDDFGFIRNDNGEISIAIVKKVRNNGIASAVLSDFSGSATIKIGNTASFYAFLNAGFKPVGFIMKKDKKQKG